MFDVVEVVLEFEEGVFLGGAVALFDQAPAGHAGLDGVPHPVEGDFPGQFFRVQAWG